MDKIRVLNIITVVALLAAVAAGNSVGEEDVASDLKKHIHPDVLYHRNPLPAENNAYTFWIQAIEKMKEISEEFPEIREAYKKVQRTQRMFSDTELDTSVKMWVQLNRETFELFDKGLKKGKCQFPERHLLDKNYKMPDLGSFREFARLLCYKGRMLALEQGRYKDAASQFKRVLDFGHLIRSGEGGFLEHMSAQAIEQRGLQEIEWLARKKDVPSGILIDLIKHAELRDNYFDYIPATIRIEFTTDIFNIIQHVPDDREGMISLINDEKGHIFEYIPSVLFHSPGWDDLIDAETEGERKSIRKKNREAANKVFRLILEVNPDPLNKAETLKTASRFYADCIKMVERDTPERKNFIKRSYRSVMGIPKDGKKNNAEINILPDFDGTSIIKDMELIKELEEKIYNNTASAEDISKARQYFTESKNPMGSIILTTVFFSIMPLNTYYHYNWEYEGTKALLAVQVYRKKNKRLPASLQELVNTGILPRVPYDIGSDNPLKYSKERKLIWNVGYNLKDDRGSEHDDRVWKIDE
jgi:hypothetical protein